MTEHRAYGALLAGREGIVRKVCNLDFTIEDHIDLQKLVTPKIASNMIRRGEKFDLAVQDDELGKGGFGQIYRCKISTGATEKALKVIKSSEEGIPCLMELSLMASCLHPCLMRADAVSASSRQLSMMMDLALWDLARWRHNLNTPELDPSRVRDVMHSVTAGLEYLHANGLIHGDVKADNVLVFPGPKFKLCDYTLSLNAAWVTEEAPSVPYKPVGTMCYRPLEVLQRKLYSHKADIWALGCTMFEVIFGYVLFPCQRKFYRKLKRKPERETVRIASINCITHWQDHLKTTGWLSNGTLLCVKDSAVQYVEPLIPAVDHSLEMHQLMYQMLSLSPDDRPSCSGIFRSSFMRSKNARPNQNAIRTEVEYLSLSQLRKKYGDQEVDRVLRLAEEPSIAQHALNMHVRVCSKTKKKETSSERSLRIAACLFMASKLVTRHQPKHMKHIVKEYGVETFEILNEEKRICETLNYQLHQMQSTKFQ